MGRAPSILWPAFLAACVLELLVFSAVDPFELHGGWAHAAGWSRQAVYTASFFLFWALSGAACALTSLLAQPAQGIDGERML